MTIPAQRKILGGLSKIAEKFQAIYIPKTAILVALTIHPWFHIDPVLTPTLHFRKVISDSREAAALVARQENPWSLTASLTLKKGGQRKTIRLPAWGLEGNFSGGELLNFGGGG